MPKATQKKEASFNLVPLPESVLKEDKAPTAKQGQVLAQILKHQYRKDVEVTYPSEILNEAQEKGHLEGMSRQMIVKTFNSLEEKSLIRESGRDDIPKPGNISSYYELTDRGLLFASLYAKENGMEETEIKQTIREMLEKRGFDEDEQEMVISLRDLKL